MSFFVVILERNIAIEFLNNFLSVEELTRLQCSCKSVQKQISIWKENITVEKLELNEEIKLLSLIKNSHKNVKRINITKTMSDLEYHYVTIIKKVEELKANNISKNGLLFITSSMSSLTELTLSRNSAFAPSLYHDEFDSITHLSNLNTLKISQMHYFDDNAGVNFHKLKFLRSFAVLDVPYFFETENNFISTLTKITKLSIINCGLHDEDLKRICFGCQSVEDLDVQYNFLLTSAGLRNIQLLKNIDSFHFNIWSSLAFGLTFPQKNNVKDFEKLGDEKFNCGSQLFWEKFNNISTLTFLDLGGSCIDEEDRLHISKQVTLFNYQLPELRFTVIRDQKKRRRASIALCKEIIEGKK
jgi:hypothetical protein